MKTDIDLTILYEKLFRYAAGGTIQQVMDEVCTATGIPILAVDVAYNVLGIAPADKTGEYTWDYLLENRGFDIEHTMREYESGTMQSVAGRKAPYVIDWGKNAALPKILGLITVGGQVEGYITMQCRRGEAGQTLLRIMEAVQDVCSILYGKVSKNTDSVHLHMKNFAMNLLAHRFRTQKDIELWRKTAGFFPEGSYRVCAIETAVIDSLNVLNCIKQNIRTSLTSCLAFSRKNTLFVLQYRISKGEHGMPLPDSILTLMESLGASCGVSDVFEDLAEFEAYEFQAVSALATARHEGKAICRFTESYIDALINPKLYTLPASAYMLPELLRLQAFDREHESELIHTLECLIKQRFSTSAAAAELHLHRNTMLYRIDKIEEILGMSLQSERILDVAVCLRLCRLLETHQ